MNDATPLPAAGPARPRNSLSRASEASFRDRVASLGGEVLEPLEWTVSTIKYACRCPAGHGCMVSPHRLRTGGLLCSICPEARSVAAEAKFRQRVHDAGGTVTGTWVNNRTPIAVTCIAGHSCCPYPSSVIQGMGFCLECAGKSPAGAERKFRELVAERGGVFVGPWTGSRDGIPCICAAGHDCWPQSASLASGQGLCGSCAGNSPEDAEREFRRRLAEAGATLDDVYLGSEKAHWATCARGHRMTVRPKGLREREALCPECQSGDAEGAFVEMVTALGGTYIGPWGGRDGRSAIICPEGHYATTRPADLRRGRGGCRFCAGKTWNTFYIVASCEELKFGITSGDGRPRLARHAQLGLTTVVRLRTGLPGSLAPDTERAVLAALADAGDTPVRGREYFRLEALALVLDVADGWLSAA